MPLFAEPYHGNPRGLHSASTRRGRSQEFLREPTRCCRRPPRSKEVAAVDTLGSPRRRRVAESSANGRVGLSPTIPVHFPGTTTTSFFATAARSRRCGSALAGCTARSQRMGDRSGNANLSRWRSKLASLLRRGSKNLRLNAPPRGVSERSGAISLYELEPMETVTGEPSSRRESGRGSRASSNDPAPRRAYSRSSSRAEAGSCSGRIASTRS